MNRLKTITDLIESDPGYGIINIPRKPGKVSEFLVGSNRGNLGMKTSFRPGLERI